LGTLLFGLTVAPAHAAQEVRWDLHELAPGVYASVVAPPTHPSSHANSLIVINEDHVVVVDTRDSPRAARALLASIRELTDLPVRRIVVTHRHWDHHLGTQVFVDEFPDVEIVAHPHTQTHLREHGEAERDAQLARRPDLANVPIRAPTDTVRTQRVWKEGGREIRVIHPGPAHTPGDLVVYLPGERILATGDLIEQGRPWFGDGTVLGSAQALDRLALLDVVTIVPGHSRLLSNDRLLRDQTAFVRALADAARAAPDSAHIVDKSLAERELLAFAPAFAGVDGGGRQPFAEYASATLTQAVSERDDYAEAPGACVSTAARAFDFWIGSWEVTTPQGQLAGHNRIESALGGCVLRENWVGTSGNAGHSFNTYDARRGVWHQTWVDNQGSLLLLEGGLVEAAMVLEGETSGPAGQRVLNRITWSVESGDGSRVRQLWETSTDAGATWSIAFDGQYQRLSPRE